jgi:signal transduction histidine kinase
MLGAAALVALWTNLMFTRAGEVRADQTRLRIYFLGMLVGGAALMSLSGSFFVYLITAFIHTFVLRPAALEFVGVGLTSLILNRGFISANPAASEWWTYAVIVVIQTTVVGFGVIGGSKIGELSEERRRSLRELEAALQENAGLHAQLVEQAREAGTADERQRMAREIHDTIAQGLIGVITQLESAGQVRNDPIGLQRRLDNASRLARESLAEARRSVQALLPIPLEGRQLPDAISHVAEEWSIVNEVPTEVITTGTALALRPEVEVTVLRVVQEALANIAKHARASRVGVTLSYIDEIITIDVRDDGAGFTPNGTGTGFGLAAMRQRVEALGGDLDIESAPGEGTAISARLPSEANHHV